MLSVVEKGGLYLPDCGLWMDPRRAKPFAVVSHAHADHTARHQSYLATAPTIDCMRVRMGDAVAERGVALGYGEIYQHGALRIQLFPAGHVLGSAMVRVEAPNGDSLLYTGDFKTRSGLAAERIEIPQADTLIMESTFGRPEFVFPPAETLQQQIRGFCVDALAAGKVPILLAYSLGKAQRLLHLLDPAIGPILTHAAVENTNAVLRAQGVPLPDTIRITPDLDRKAHPGALIVAPPAVLDRPWARRFGALSTGYASGWMQMRGVRRRRAADRGFVISDHADWPGLLGAIRETGAENLFLTHGYTEIFTRHLREQGYNAHILATEFGGEEADDTPDTGETA